MTRTMRLFLCALALLVALPSLSQSRTPVGSIWGTVLDDAGRPLQAAKVNAELFGVPAVMAKPVNYVTTDERGSFLIEVLELGTYVINAGREDAGYPDIIGFSFYADKPAATVTLSTQSPNAQVVLRLGPKAGVIAGTVRDAVSGKPIPSGFMLRYANNPNRFLSTSAPPTFRILVPSAADIKVEVSAPGYESWHYADPSSPPEPSLLRLEPGTERHLDVLLRPKLGADVARFLIPEGFVGWARIEYRVESAASLSNQSDLAEYKLPLDGVLNVGSAMPDIGVHKEYFLYSTDGTLAPVPSDYWNGRGLIWGEYEGSRGGERRLLGFYVGTEQQYQEHKHPPMN